MPLPIVRTVADLRVQVGAWKAAGLHVGLVPTMGALHEGHLSLVRLAKGRADRVVASIFVNPTQFGPNEDFSRYPRDPERDLAMLGEAGVDWVFTPSVDEMYPKGFSTYVDVREITRRLEGEMRPGHFTGVATVVAKLFNIVRPTRAYFGQKDAQQVAVLRKMVADLAFPLQVVVAPTLREPDGLAMSSRNIYLAPDERQAALCLSRALHAASALWEKGERRGSALREAMQAVISAEPLARPDYVSVADPLTLEELDDTGAATAALASLAVRIGKTRLIDNLVLGDA
jgi:pantoate--beta-alanine ligase